MNIFSWFHNRLLAIEQALGLVHPPAPADALLHVTVAAPPSSPAPAQPASLLPGGAAYVPPQFVFGPAGADGKPTVVYQPSYGSVGLFVNAVHQQTGGYNFTVVNAQGQPLDTAGNPIAPASGGGSQPDQSRTTFDKFGDFPARNTLADGVPASYTVIAPAGGTITFDVAESIDTVPGGELTLIVTDTAGREVAQDAGPFSNARSVSWTAAVGAHYGVVATYVLPAQFKDRKTSTFDMNIKQGG